MVELDKTFEEMKIKLSLMLDNNFTINPKYKNHFFYSFSNYNKSDLVEIINYEYSDGENTYEFGSIEPLDEGCNQVIFTRKD